jgi:hypothetical protein
VSGVRRSAVLASAAAALLGLAGCNTYRAVPPLDDGERAELAALGSRLGGFRVNVVPATPAAVDDANDVMEVLRHAGADVGATDAAVSVFVGSARILEPIAEGEGEALFFLLTLGLWPQTWSHTVEWRFKIVATDGRSESFTAATTRPGFCSWVAGPYALFSGWRFGGPGCRAGSDSDAERARRRARAVLALARHLAAMAP